MRNGFTPEKRVVSVPAIGSHPRRRAPAGRKAGRRGRSVDSRTTFEHWKIMKRFVWQNWSRMVAMAWLVLASARPARRARGCSATGMVHLPGRHHRRLCQRHRRGPRGQPGHHRQHLLGRLGCRRPQHQPAWLARRLCGQDDPGRSAALGHLPGRSKRRRGKRHRGGSGQRHCGHWQHAVARLGVWSLRNELLWHELQRQRQAGRVCGEAESGRGDPLVELRGRRPTGRMDGRWPWTAPTTF